MITDTRELPTSATLDDVGHVWTELLDSRIARLIATVIVIALTMCLVARASAHAGDSIEAVPGAILSLGERPSHNRRYFAEVVSAPAIAVGTPQSWTIRVARRNGRRVANARVAVKAWMPEQDSVSLTVADIAYVGSGRYRVSHMEFLKPGWWNVALVIDGSAGVDSLAFNLVLPDVRRTPPSRP